MTEGPIWSFTTKSSTNTAPDKPTISGTDQGQAGKPYTYSFVCTDPENDDLYLYVEWGDGTTSGWQGPYSSGQEITLEHTWTDIGSYMIRAKAKDIHDIEGEWGRLPITMPLRTFLSQRPFFTLIHSILLKYPFLNQIIMNILN
jgi:hypothetical protein